MDWKDHRRERTPIRRAPDEILQLIGSFFWKYTDTIVEKAKETRNQVTMMKGSKAKAASKKAEAPAAKPYGVTSTSNMDMFSDFGKDLFTGAVADKYLKKQGLSANVLKSPSWVKDHADAVANAVFDW